MGEVVIVSAMRSPIGKFGGALAQLSAPELCAQIICKALEKASVLPNQVDAVYLGNVLQAGQGQNPARQAALLANLPVSVPAVTINAVCGSGLESVRIAANAIAVGDAEIAVAGGMEAMSGAPYLLDKARFGYRMNDGVLKDSLINDALWDVYGNYHMGVTAENVANEYSISRQEQDAFAAYSQQKCEKARKNNLFVNEIAPVTIKNKKETFVMENDEYPRDNVTKESISKLKPAFAQNGTVTPANASGINDGAAVIVLMAKKKAEELGIEPMAQYVCGAMAGVEPRVMGIGAAVAAQKAMEKINITADDLTLIEANEAFAAQSIACAKLAGWENEANAKKVNVNGGSIALGHPVGASGCRILVTLLHALEQKGKGLGLATLCIGGGMGVSVIVKKG